MIDEEVLFNAYQNPSISNEDVMHLFFMCQSMSAQKKLLWHLLVKYRKQPKPSGRPRINIDEELFEKCYIQWKNKEITAKKFMKTLNIYPNTFYRRVKEYENGKKD